MAASRNHCDIARDVFFENYERLTNLNLSMLDSCLVSKRIITLSDQENIMAAQTNRKKSTLILLAIANHIESDFSNSLHIMLDFMIEKGDCAMKKLADEMKCKLPEECTSALAEDEEQSIESYIQMLNKLPVVFATPRLPVVKDESISELENPVQSVLNYLQRSLSIMIKSVMSRLYGTKETLQIMHLVSLKLSSLSENLKRGFREKLDLTIKRCCKFQKRECIETDDYKDWLWHCKQMLPLDSDPRKEWDLSEDLTSWNLDVCLKLLQYAKGDDDTLLFDSKYICFKSSTSVYSFSELAAELWYHSLRSSYSLRNSNKKCEKHSMKIVEEFALKLLQWFTNEDGDLNNIAICKEDVEKIYQIQKDYFDINMAKWGEILKNLNSFNFNDYEFILVSASCTGRVGVDISSKDLAYLSIIPWAAVVDFDTKSKEDGLLNSFCKPESNHLKDSCMSTGKQRIVDIFSINNIDCASKQSEFHIPWLFPHGESHNQTDKACPLNDYKQYKLMVRQPLNNAVKELAKMLSIKKAGGIISVVLCYGDYACKCKNTPYENFLHDLNHFCCNLEDYGNVVVLTDNASLKQRLEPLPVCTFSLNKLCEKIRSFFPENKDDLPPIVMPGQFGPERIDCIIEKDFELIHASIFEYEMHKYENQKIVKLLPTERDEIKIRTEIYDEVKVNFYKGQTVTWISLKRCHAITRTVETKITKSIRGMLNKHKTEPTKYVLYHLPGAGATTLARKILWELRNDFPCVILKSDYILSDEKAIQTIKSLKDLYATLQLPILMLIDEEPFVNTVAILSNHAQSNSIPMVFFHVQRINKSKKSKLDLKKQGYKASILLENKLCEEDIKSLQDQLVEDYGKERVIAGNEKIKKMNLSMMSDPKEQDRVTDLNKHGLITHIRPHKIDKMLSCFLIDVHWEDGETETCYLSNTDNYDIKKRRVFLSTNISKMAMYEFYKTIHFYGLMCLDELFHEPMHNHIKTCMESLTDDELNILANISLLFAFNVCESIHSKAYENLCYKITRQTRKPKFQIEDFIPKIALQFVTIIPAHYRFRIVHPFVAREIVECYFLAVKVSKLQFLQDYLNCMLSETAKQPEVSEAVNRLLFYREYDDTIKRQQFSSLILTIENYWACSKGAAETLKYAASKVNNCHSYGHYARYLSKRLHEHDNAIKILEKAQKKASQPNEEALVYNIEGDIHRDRLEHYLKQHETLNWKSTDNKAFKFHLYACQAYHDSRQSNPMVDHPLFGELSVRLMLLEDIKRKVHKSKFFDILHDCGSIEVVNSIDTCHYLIEKLKDFVHSGEGGKDADSYEHSVAVQENRFTAIAGSVHDQKKNLIKLMKTCSNDVHQAHFRRSYVSLCIDIKLHNPRECIYWQDLKDFTEKNFEHLGYNDRDMNNWVQIIKNVSGVARDMNAIEEQLLLWKDGPCVTPNKESVRSKNNPLFVYFYLTICYFVQLVETKEDEVYDIVCKVKKYREETNKRSELIKSRGRVKEWLHKDGSGFERLKSGKQKREEMLQLNGSVVYPSWQEALQHNVTQFPHISWKGLAIFFDPNATGHMYGFKRDDQVEFTVGFTFKGPRAITCTRVSSAHSKKITENYCDE